MTETGHIPYFDAHCDTISRCTHRGRRLGKNEGHVDIERLSRFEKAAQVFAIFADARYYPDGMFDECRAQREVFCRELAANEAAVRQCFKKGDVAAANAEGKIAALLTVEGAELLDCDPGKLETAQAWGVRMINITWNHSNLLSGSCRDQADRGLSPAGRDFVREAERLGIILDVSHLSDRGFWDLEKMTGLPMVASHSCARAVWPHERNLTDDMFRAVRDSGGVVGLNLFRMFIGGGEGIDDALRHVEHFMELGGEKTLALGGDWDGCELIDGLRGVEDVPALWDALTGHGYSREILEDLFYNNLLRVLG